MGLIKAKSVKTPPSCRVIFATLSNVTRISALQEKEKSLMSLSVFLTVSVKLMYCKSLLFM